MLWTVHDLSLSSRNQIVRRLTRGEYARKLYFYAFQSTRKVKVFIGSANCSRAALAIPGGPGNADEPEAGGDRKSGTMAFNQAK